MKRFLFADTQTIAIDKIIRIWKSSLCVKVEIENSRAEYNLHPKINQSVQELYEDLQRQLMGDQ